MFKKKKNNRQIVSETKSVVRRKPMRSVTEPFACYFNKTAKQYLHN